MPFLSPHIHSFREIERPRPKSVNVFSYLMGNMNINLLKTKSSQTDELLLIIEDHGLTQLISEPTRITNHSQSLIDVLNDNLISEAGTIAVTGSDHLMIYGECTENFRA